MILKDSSIRDQIFVFLEKRTEDKIVLQLNQQFGIGDVSIEDLKEKSLAQDGGKTYQYVLQLIRFFANLCFGNNYLAIYSLRPLYTLGTCISIATNPQLDNEIRGAFSELITRLWTSNS